MMSIIYIYEQHLFAIMQWKFERPSFDENMVLPVRIEKTADPIFFWPTSIFLPFNYYIRSVHSVEIFEILSVFHIVVINTPIANNCISNTSTKSNKEHGVKKEV